MAPPRKTRAKGKHDLGRSVYAHVLGAILGGAYDGRRISDIAIAKELRVSRTPVREALLRLEHEGLVTRDGARRLVVGRISAEDVAHIYPIVAALEGLAGRLAAPRLTAADLKELRALDAKMQSAAQAGDVTMFFNTNSAFHEIFIRRASNPRLEREIGKFRLLMRNFRIFLMKIPGRMKTSIDEHSAIIEAFAAKDVDRAEAAIRNHASSAEQALLQALDAVRMLS